MAVASRLAANARYERVRRAALERWHVLTVAAIVVAITAANLVWFSMETRPPHFDMAGHLERALWYRDYLLDAHPFQFLTAFNYYPPLVYWVANAFYVALGPEPWVAILSNTVFLAVLAFSVFALGRLLWSPRVGLVATVFVLATPVLVTQFKEFQLDAPLTALTALALYLLVRAQEFARRAPSVLLGVAVGAGMLTKWTFVLALVLPVLVAGGIGLVWAMRERSLDRIWNMLLAALGLYAVMAPWWLPNWALWRATAQDHTGGAFLEGVVAPDWYLWRLVDPQLYLIPLLLFAVGVVLSLVDRESLRRNRYPLLLVVGTYVAFTLVAFKDVRYTLPMLAGVAIVAASPLDRLPRVWRDVGSLAVVAYSAVAFAAVSFGIGVLPDRVSVQVASRDVALFAQRGYIIGPPSGEKWYQEEMFLDARRAAPGRASLRFEGPSGDLWFNASGLRYFSKRYGVPLAGSREEATFVAVRGAEVAPVPRGFSRVRAVTLPDGSRLSTFRRGD